MASLARPQAAERRVLVVEDEVLIRAALADDLRQAGLAVVETGNADEAWSYLQAGGRADLVFSDICMAGVIDGLALARRLRQHYPDLCVILTSGTRRFLEGETFKFVPKPYDGRRVAQAIVDILALKPSDTDCDIARHG